MIMKSLAAIELLGRKRGEGEIDFLDYSKTYSFAG